MIEQSITDVAQYGTDTAISVSANTISLTPCQTYLIIFLSFLVICFIAYLIKSVIKSYLLKSCSGCKRLAKCEREIEHLKECLVLNKIVDVDILKDISKKVDELKQEIQK